MINRIAKKLYSFITNEYKYLKPEIKCNSKWYGNSYGGFYINPDFINSDSIIYSFGIGEDISFDETVIKEHNATIYAFDPTPKSIEWLKNNISSDKFIFHKYGLSNKTGKMDFYLPKNEDHVSGSLVMQTVVDEERKISVNMKSIRDIIKDLKHDRIDILKMDIEGAEYDVIDDILSVDIPIAQILIEFHSRFFASGTEMTKNTIQKLRENGYIIYAVSKSKQEVSFINKNLITQ